MGLAISRSIAEAHGGQLSAAPNQPHGAVFRFTLPAEEKSSEGARSHRVDRMRSIVVRQEGG
jgi:K+-sensing histidine kinase KdpD